MTNCRVGHWAFSRQNGIKRNRCNRQTVHPCFTCRRVLLHWLTTPSDGQGTEHTRTLEHSSIKISFICPAGRETDRQSEGLASDCVRKHYKLLTFCPRIQLTRNIEPDRKLPHRYIIKYVVRYMGLADLNFLFLQYGYRLYTSSLLLLLSSVKCWGHHLSRSVGTSCLGLEIFVVRPRGIVFYSITVYFNDSFAGTLRPS
jgi:hypothetical protein